MVEAVPALPTESPETSRDPLNQTLLRQIAEERLLEARALFDAKKWSGAYYIAGYALECGFKARIASYTQQYDFPDKDLAQKCYTYNLVRLREAADLESVFTTAARTNPVLNRHWGIVKDWNERARYRLYTEQEARLFLHAIDDPNN